MAASVKLKMRRRPFILRPERKGREPWMKVLHNLGVSRGLGPGWADSFTAGLAARGSPLGIHFDFGGDVANSMDSLRLLHFASTCPAFDPFFDEELQERLADALATGHFEARRCVGDHSALAAAAAAAFDSGPFASHEPRHPRDGPPSAWSREPFLAAARAVIADPTAYRDDVLGAIARAAADGHAAIPVFSFSLGAFASDRGADGVVPVCVGEVSGAASVADYRAVLRTAAGL